MQNGRQNSLMIAILTDHPEPGPAPYSLQLCRFAHIKRWSSLCFRQRLIALQLSVCRHLYGRLIISLVVLFSTTLYASASLADSELVVTGVTGRLAENIRLLVAEPPERDNARQFRRYVNGLPEQVINAMGAYGYYAAEATVSVDEITGPARKSRPAELVDKVGEALGVNGSNASTSAEKVPANSASDSASDPSSEATPGPTEETAATFTRITVAVTANEPVKIRQLDVQITGLEKDNTDFETLLDTIRLQLAQGKVFVSSDYETAKTSMISTAQNLGYFDFEFITASVAVSRRGKTADISLVAAAGTRYTFGETLFKQRTFSRSFMQRWLPFAPGDPYDAAQVSELTQNLQSSGYFSSVRVRPEINPRYVDTVPLIVDLKERDNNQVAVGLGYSTDTEVRTSLSWNKPLINSYGHSAKWGISLAKEEQSVSFAYRIPRLDQPRFNYWGIEYGLKNERDSDNDLDSFLSSLSLQRVSRTKNNWTESFFIRYDRERFSVNDVERTTDLVLPGFNYSRTRSRGQPFTTWAQTVSLQLMGGSKRVLSSIDFLKGVGRFRYLRSLADKHTLITTLQLGGIFSNDDEGVPVSQRFFAGGDRTVRGFAYRSIAPTDDDGDAIGGQFLEVGNLEYNYRFKDRWSAAIFTDAGRAFDNFDTAYSVGAGFGVRWQSPVGQLRIDLARPFSDGDGTNWRVHLSLGTDT